MKKLILASFLVLLAFNACDNIPSEVIESADPNYRILAVNAPTVFTQTPTDSIFTTSIKFENTETISSVWFNIVTDDGTASIKQNVEMLDDGSSTSGDLNEGDGAYTGRTVLGSSISTGTYVVEYYVENNVRIGSDKVQLVSSHNLEFKSSKDNVAPVLSNLVMPNTIARAQQFIFSVDASDENGYLDISRVYYEVFDPEGNQIQNSQGITKFPMFDDGATGGDETAKDGTFTVALTFPESFATGDYRFEITAEDNLSTLSNTIIHTLTVQ